MKIIGLIPARKGSKRIPGKNMALLCGKPLLQYAIEGAKASGVFGRIAVSSDYEPWLDWVSVFAPDVDRILRPSEISQDLSHDFEWVKDALERFDPFDIFVILRPTSPFRAGETIRRAITQFEKKDIDSMRAVEKTKHHPRKSWVKAMFGLMVPYVPWYDNEIEPFPSYDLPIQSLGEVYTQNGCIHIAKTEVIEKFGNVSGDNIAPFFTEGYEGLDINTPEDLQYAEWIMRGKP